MYQFSAPCACALGWLVAAPPSAPPPRAPGGRHPRGPRHRPSSGRVGGALADARPGRAGIIQSVEPALGGERLDHRVDARRLHAAVHTELMRPMSPFGRPLASLVQLRPRVRGFVVPLSGPPPMNWPVARRRCHIAAYSASGLAGSISTSLAPVSALTVRTRGPRLAAVGRLVHAAVAACRPQRALRCDVHDVGNRGILQVAECSELASPTRAHVTPASADL